jgi:hypothetical protein
MVENAILRQQVMVLNRQMKRPKFTDGDRLRFVLFSSFDRLLAHSPACYTTRNAAEVASGPLWPLLETKIFGQEPQTAPSLRDD